MMSSLNHVRHHALLLGLSFTSNAQLGEQDLAKWYLQLQLYFII